MATNFEQVFADQAQAVLSERLPSILPKRIGFELLDKKDDTQAVGVSGFRVANKWVYIPCFFSNGKIQGQEMMYLKDNDLFVPATEAWLEYLLNDEAVDLGKPMDPGSYKTQPLNLTDILRPPFVLKNASVEEKNTVLEWLHGDRGTMNSLTLKAIQRNRKMAMKLAFTMRRNPDLADAVLRYFSMDELEHATQPIKRAAEATEDSIQFPSTVITDNYQVVNGPGKWKVMGLSKDEITVSVFRTDDSTWFVYDAENEYGQEVDSLSRLGFWGVLEDPIPFKGEDDFSKATVLSHQDGKGGMSDYRQRQFMIVQKDRVLWRGSIDDVIKTGKDVTFKVFSSYSVLGPSMRRRGRITQILVSPDIKKPSKVRTGIEFNDDLYTLMLPKEGTEFLHIAGEALPAAMTWEMALSEATRGTKKASQLRIDYSGDFLIRCGEYSAASLGYKKAHSVLTKNIGVEDAVATSLLKSASLNRCIKALVKYGSGFPSFFGDQGANTSFAGYPAESSQTENIEMPDIMDDTEVNRVMRSAESGQKRVFDVGVLSALANRLDVDGAIDEQIPDIIQGMDRVGRMLFLFYWKYDEFADRYGDQEVTKLHDSLKDVFEATGDLVMFLKNKLVSGHKQRVEESADIE